MAADQLESRTQTHTQPPAPGNGRQPEGHTAAAPPDGPKRRSSRTSRVVAWLLVLLVFGGAFYWALHRGGTGASNATAKGAARGGFGPVTATVATAEKGDLGVYLEAIGTVTPVYTASITAQANGVITAVHFREGQLVRKGDPLIDIDPRSYQATLLQSEGALERDTHILEQAQMDLERYRNAWAKNAIPKQTLDDQEKIVLQDQGTVKNDQGTVQYNEVQLGYTHITSPISGRAGLRLIDPGNVVQANSTTTLVVITQVDPITVIFTIPEDNLGDVLKQLRKGAVLRVEAYDRAQQTRIANGKLSTVDNQIDTTTGTVKLRATFDNKGGVLFPNQFVNTRLLVRTLQNSTIIPTNAIQHNGQVAFVYVVADGKADLRKIKPGVADKGMTAVEGLKPGEVVATSSFEKLQNGAKVTVAKRPAQPTTGESSTTSAP